MSHEALRSAGLDVLTEGLLVVAADGTVVEINAVAARWLGIERDATAGSALPPVALLGGDGTMLAAHEHPWHVAAGTAAPVEALLIGRADGDDVAWRRVTTTPVLAGGTVAGTASVIESSGPTRNGASGTERQAVAEARVSAAFLASPVGIAILSAEGVVRDANPALSQLTARHHDDLVGANLGAHVLPEEAPNLRARLAELSSGRDDRAELELRILDGDGQVKWTLVHLARLAVARGREPEVICQMLDVTDRRQFEEQLRHVADHDSLTGLLNRRSFEQVLTTHCAEAERYGPQGALLLLDIDHFKIVNDALGHLAGDQLIITVAELLRDRLRASDTVARLGGDEFAALLPHASRAEAEAVADALLHALRSHAVSRSLNSNRPFTVSIGVAPFDQTDVTPTEMLAAADLAMYAAKEAGRDRWVAAQPVSRTHPVRSSRVTWVERIEQALAAGHFALMAQPIVSLETGEVRQQELLVRMLDDTELVSPERFLYLAERVDLVGHIDRWVIEQAADLLTAHANDAFDVCVNVAGKSMASPLVLDVLAQRLTKPAFDPRRVVFEVSESAAMTSVANTQRFVEHVATLGCRSALDDFGAGLGSLSYLKYLPFDILKIDGAVVSTCLSSAIDRTIVTAITTVADELGKLTVAESVPDQATLEFLRRAGVDLAQGYFIGHPVPLTSVFPPVAAAVARTNGG